MCCSSAGGFGEEAPLPCPPPLPGPASQTGWEVPAEEQHPATTLSPVVPEWSGPKDDICKKK